MVMQVRRVGTEIFYEQRGEDFSGVTDVTLAQMLVERKAIVTAAQEWSATATRALLTAAKQRRGAFQERLMGVDYVATVAIDTADTRVPSNLRQLQAAVEQAARDQEAAKTAFNSVRHEMARRKDQATHAAIVARHVGRTEQRAADRQAALRASVTAALPKTGIMARVDALLGR